jgi:molybdate transport system regulatory protein
MMNNDARPPFDIKTKIWFEKNGEPVFGAGRLLLLQKIESTGSINKAAKDLGFSYKKAWSYINLMEERFGYQLVNKKIGGKNGGGSVLTEDAKRIMADYKMVLNEENAFIRQLGGKLI